MQPVQRIRASVIIGILTMVTMAGSASAQEPTFKFGEKPEEVAATVEWSASAQAGLVVNTGNSEQTVLSSGAKAERRSGMNKLQIELAGTFARTNLFLALDANASGTIEASEIEEQTQTTAQAWQGKVRYDRFLTEHNSLYATAVAGGDKPAGKAFVGGAQAGYSRQLFKNDRHELVSEVGYDFSYEDFVAKDSGVAIHSGRVFAGYKGKASADTGVGGSVETLLNFNTLNAPGGEVAAFEDARITAKAELTTKLLDDISINVSFLAKYDNAPAPRPAFKLPYADGFVPLAEKLDTTTKVTVIINFL